MLPLNNDWSWRYEVLKIESEKTRSWKQMEKPSWGWCVLLKNCNLALFNDFKWSDYEKEEMVLITICLNDLKNPFFPPPSTVIHCICFDYFCNLLFSFGSFAILCEYKGNTLAWILFLVWWKQSICFSFYIGLTECNIIFPQYSYWNCQMCMCTVEIIVEC